MGSPACASRPGANAAASGPEGANVAGGPAEKPFSPDKNECVRFHTKYRGPSMAARTIPRTTVLSTDRKVAIIDPERDAATASQLEAVAASGDAWTSPHLAALAVDIRTMLAAQASAIRELLGALERRDVAVYRAASDRLIEQDKTLPAVDERFRAACGLEPEQYGEVPPVVARLPPAVIQRIVRERYDTFRKCYEAGLARNPTLEGRVQVRFVIDKNGTVESAEPAADSGRPPSLGSPELKAFWSALGVATPTEERLRSMPDPDVVSCVVQHYRDLRFPPPEGNGKVTVVYPIYFSPG